MTDYKIWKPKHDGHAPPNWRKGMPWVAYTSERATPLLRHNEVTPAWVCRYVYYVPAEALNSPNDDASGDVDAWAESDAKRILRLVESLRAYPAEELAKHGITLAPENDWATELWADLFAVRGMTGVPKNIRKGRIDEDDRAAIELLRIRFEQMKGER